MNLAILHARKSTSKFRLGAVLAYRYRLLSMGYNDMSRTHPIMHKYNTNKKIQKNLHAEVDACLGIPEHMMKGATIYVARILKDNRTANAEPCKICQRFMRAMGIKNVWHTTGHGIKEMEL